MGNLWLLAKYQECAIIIVISEQIDSAPTFICLRLSRGSWAIAVTACRNVKYFLRVNYYVQESNLDAIISFSNVTRAITLCNWMHSRNEAITVLCPSTSLLVIH